MRKVSFIATRVGGRIGYNKHIRPEMDRLNAAISGLPYFSDITPEKKHPMHPMPIIKNEKPAICSIEGLLRIFNNKSGTQAQKAYSSHICPKYPKADEI